MLSLMPVRHTYLRCARSCFESLRCLSDIYFVLCGHNGCLYCVIFYGCLLWTQLSNLISADSGGSGARAHLESILRPTPTFILVCGCCFAVCIDGCIAALPAQRSRFSKSRMWNKAGEASWHCCYVLVCSNCCAE